ncbi:Inositol oxygenase 4 [Stylosanthes scabra]|uniref:inositol oxygenase n=1 Tax=Stylosanthes scabra TaxID=79078 RepID=A0ABU6VFW9_9FABA|nr:Inositol oxygenase 4 [Stylosanthes scabra]
MEVYYLSLSLTIFILMPLTTEIENFKTGESRSSERRRAKSLCAMHIMIFDLTRNVAPPLPFQVVIFARHKVGTGKSNARQDSQRPTIACGLMRLMITLGKTFNMRLWSRQVELDGSQFDEKSVHTVTEEAKGVVLNGGFSLQKEEPHNGFTAPEINSFGQSFRDYDAESERQKGVEEFYRLQHINQTYDFVKKMREHYKKLDKAEMSIWECCELLNKVVDESDPDLDEPQIQHLLQTAEAIRKDYPNEDWLHLTALIHDLGKILLLPQFGKLPQWAVVGDTFPVGCAFDEANVHHKYFKGNPDFNHPAYSTKEGVYTKGCGLNNIMMSWGHDDYMYLVAKENGSTLPSAGLFIVRYHSFYPLHKEGAYAHLMNDEDHENLKWLHVFNKYDLYSKSKVLVDVEKVKPYYQTISPLFRSIFLQNLNGEASKDQGVRRELNFIPTSMLWTLLKLINPLHFMSFNM